MEDKEADEEKVGLADGSTLLDGELLLLVDQVMLLDADPLALLKWLPVQVIDGDTLNENEDDTLDDPVTETELNKDGLRLEDAETLVDIEMLPVDEKEMLPLTVPDALLEQLPLIVGDTLTVLVTDGETVNESVAETELEEEKLTARDSDPLAESDIVKVDDIDHETLAEPDPVGD